MLALQLMQLMKNVWAGLGLPVCVFPYRFVLALSFFSAQLFQGVFLAAEKRQSVELLNLYLPSRSFVFIACNTNFGFFQLLSEDGLELCIVLQMFLTCF